MVMTTKNASCMAAQLALNLAWCLIAHISNVTDLTLDHIAVRNDALAFTTRSPNVTKLVCEHGRITRGSCMRIQPTSCATSC